MKIAFCGSNSVGKTTLLNKLKELERFKDFTFCDEITRKIKRKGFSINEGGSNSTQILIMASHIENLQHRNMIADRCALDGYIYTRWLRLQNKVSPRISGASKEIMEENLNKYDYIFYLPIEFELEDDGERSNSEDFRVEIDNMFRYYLFNNIDKIKNVYVLNGSVDERVEQILKTIK